MKKSNKWMVLGALLFCSTAVVSCDDDDEDNNMSEQERGRIEAFMMRAAQSDMFEITTGDMAEEKGQM